MRPDRLHILFVENHAEFARIVIMEFLAPHEVTVVPGLAEGRLALSAARYDLILCDYDLDDGKGDELVSECRAAHPELPVIAVSSHDEGNAALVRAGASAVCEKMKFHRIGEV